MQVVISEPPKKLVEFKMVPRGGIFRANGNLFMKLYRDYEMGDSKYNCVSVEYAQNDFYMAGGLYHCVPDDKVEVPSREELHVSFA